jgi:hypothetical protein
MSIEDRLESLRTKHAALEAELEHETHRPCPDDTHIYDLKRQKLKLKDEMHRLSP